jgi:hypothetical protein
METASSISSEGSRISGNTALGGGEEGMGCASRRLEGLGSVFTKMRSVFTKGAGEEESIEMGLFKVPFLTTGEDESIQMGLLELFSMSHYTKDNEMFA